MAAVNMPVYCREMRSTLDEENVTVEVTFSATC
jgi:hypothetical protein